ncbi:nuclease domain-containing protein [Culturomica massiliensis]|uniref:nuclease domain-containing protein n=1 Tax=Culturomica massiliensis TaxID=1841857 RepID=UPI003AF138AC
MSYRKEDIWKMHAYRDAIRRSAGAYILYPGTGSFEKRGFHEILPGIGAFAINPTKYSQGVEDLKKFLKEVVVHFLNRTSQREKMAYRTYEIFKENQPIVVKEHLPEYIGENRGLFPDETAVLVGFYKSEEHWDWIVKHKMYNVRLGTRRGAVKLEAGLIHAKYVLLHTTGELRTSRLYRIVPGGPQIYSRNDLIRKHYPVSEKEKGKEAFYLVYSLEEVKEPELKDRVWNVSSLPDYVGRRGSAIPFVVLLSELMGLRG